MDRASARQLIEQYFTSWVKTDADGFLRTLHPDAVVRECTGDVYRGRQSHEEWFRTWNTGGNAVRYWDIYSLGYDSDERTAFVEWRFGCTFDHKEYDWLGASIVHFDDERILELNEYERKDAKGE